MGKKATLSSASGRSKSVNHQIVDFISLRENHSSLNPWKLGSLETWNQGTLEAGNQAATRTLSHTPTPIRGYGGEKSNFVDKQALQEPTKQLRDEQSTLLLIQ